MGQQGVIDGESGENDNDELASLKRNDRVSMGLRKDPGSWFQTYRSEEMYEQVLVNTKASDTK